MMLGTTTTFTRFPDFTHLERETRTIRYFNGRQFFINQRICYFAADDGGHFSKRDTFVHVSTGAYRSKMIRASFSGLMSMALPHPDLVAYNALYPEDDSQAVPF
jgi:hypothetical protein